MAKYGEVISSQVASHPWQSLSAKAHLGCEDYIRGRITRFNPNDQKEIQWMLEQNVLTPASLKQLGDSIIQDIKVPAETRTTVLAARLKNILRQYAPEGKEFSAGEKEMYFRFTIVPKGERFLAFVQGEEKYGESVMHGEGNTEFEALKSLVEALKVLVPQK